MSKKKGLYDRLNPSVADQSVQSKDKFENADLVVAMSRVKLQRMQDAPSEADAVVTDASTVGKTPSDVALA